MYKPVRRFDVRNTKQEERRKKTPENVDLLKMFSVIYY